MPKRGQNLKVGRGDRASKSSEKSGCFPSKAELRGGVVEPHGGASDGKLHLALLPYCQKLGLYGAPFKEGKGVCCRMVYGDKPSPLYNFRQVLADYALAMSRDREFPSTVDGLEELYQYKFVYSNGVDPDQTGKMRKNAVACFMNEDGTIMMDFLLMVEDFVSWRAELYDEDHEKLQLPEIVVHNYTDVNNQFDSKLELHCTVKVKAGDGDQFSVTDVPPPVYPKRFVVMQVASEKPTHMDFTISGNCKPFATGLASKRIPVKNVKQNPQDTYYEKFYTLHDFIIANSQNKDFILKDLLVDVFGCCPIILKISGSSFEGPAGDFLDEMKALSYIYP